MFTLTSAAAQQIQQAALAGNAENLALRLAAKLDTDGSLQYGMGFDDPQDEDIKLNIQGIPIVMGAQYQDTLENTTLDFVELRPGEFNFIFMDGHQTSPELADSGSSVGGGGCGACGSQSGGCH